MNLSSSFPVTIGDCLADALTGIYNRRYYEERIRNSNMSAGVAMMDS